MKKALLALTLVLVCALPVHTQIFTPNLNLQLPPHGAQNWDTALNANFTTLDTTVGILQLPFQGPWSAAISYFKGQQVTLNSVLYTSLQNSNLNNNPATSPSFWVATFSPGSSSVNFGFTSGSLCYTWGFTADTSLGRLGAGSLGVGSVTCGTTSGSLTGAAFNSSTYADRGIALQNSAFEGNSTFTNGAPPGWQLFGGTPGVSYETISQAPGKIQSIRIASAVQNTGLQTISKFSVVPGDTYSVSVLAKTDGSGIALLELEFNNAAGSQIGSINTSTGSTSWGTLINSGTVPANAISATVLLINNSATQPSTVWFDEIEVKQTNFVAPVSILESGVTNALAITRTDTGPLLSSLVGGAASNTTIAHCVQAPSSGSNQAWYFGTQINASNMFEIVSSGGTNKDCNNHIQGTSEMTLDTSGNATFSGAVKGTTLTGTGLTSGNCVQATAGGLLTTTGAACGTSSGTVTTTGSPASGQGTFMSGATSITSSANWLYAAASGHSVTQGANNVDAFFMNRFTDTSPTGNFLHFQNNAKNTDLFKVDVTGTMTVGIIPISSVTLNNSTNTSGHVPRNNGTQYVDAQLAAADLSNGVTGSGNVVLTTSPSIGTPSITSPSTTGTDNGTETVNNKRVNPRAVAMANSSTITPTSDTADINTDSLTIAAGTLTVAAPTGTPVDGQKLVLRVKSTNAQTYSFNATYHFSTTVTAPVTLAAGTTDYIGLMWNATNSAWDVVAVDQGH